MPDHSTTKTRFIARYRIAAAHRAVAESAAAALALEQSVEVPLAAVFDPWVREHVVGRVEDLTNQDAEHYIATLSLSVASTGLDVAQTINMLFGNASLHPHVTLVDAQLPEALLRALRGPRFGIQGLRDRTGAHRRPLTCAALKPQGLAPKALAKLCFDLAANGIDIIKDDHGLADQDYAPFQARVAACQRAIQAAALETGRTALYAPSLVGAPNALITQTQIVHEHGVGAVLLAPALIGMPVFHALVSEHLKVPVLAHPAYAGATRVEPAFLLGSFFRAMGADAVIYPHHGGRFAFDAGRCVAIAQAARGAWGEIRAALPVPAGGMQVDRVAELVQFYGHDVMLLIGGALLTAGQDLPAQTRAFVQAVAQSGTVAAT